MSEGAAFYYVIYGLQAGLAAILGTLLFRLSRRDPARNHLRYWSWSWVVLAAYSLSGILVGQLPRAGAPDLAVGFFVLLALITAYWQPALVIFGTRVLASQRALPKRTVWTVLLGLAVFAVLMALIPGDMDLRRFLAVGINAAALAVIFPLTWWALRRSRAAADFRGARLLAVAFLALGVSRLLVLGRQSYMLVSDELPTAGFVLEALELLIYVVIGLGMIIWLLEEEQSRSRRLQERIDQARRLESLGQMSSQILHNFSNLLAVIGGYLDLLGEDEALSGRRAGELQAIADAQERAVDLARDLLRFGRRESTTGESHRLEEIVGSMRPILEQLVGQRVSLELSLEESGWTRTETSRIEEILMNLVTNGRDAMREGGQLTIATGTAEVDASLRGSSTVIPVGSYCVLRVRDTGEGMTDEVRSRIFEPFFTTKQARGGTGLGLSAVYAHVEDSGGVIDVESAPGHGTTIAVYLPRQSPSAVS